MKRTLTVFLALAAVLAGCGHAQTGLLGAQVAAASLAAASTDGPPPAFPLPTFEPGDADVIYDMATFDAMQVLIAKAQHSIKLDYYIFGGPTAESLADTLVAKHRAGVDVRVLLDGAFGTVPAITSQTKPVYAKLKAGGVPVLIHDQLAIPPLTGNKAIDHNKYFVVDDQEALVGSMNLADKFYHYHDLMVHVTGPIAQDLGHQHDFDWYYAGHPGLPAPNNLVHAAPATDASNGIRLVGTGYDHKTGYEALMGLITNAHSSIHVQMHELGPGPVLDALIAAQARGVDVKLLLDPGNIAPFVPLIHMAPEGVVNAVAIHALLAAKLDVRIYHVAADFTTAHMKIGVIDDNTVFAGSINWTAGGFNWVNETDLEIHGGRAPQEAETQFQADWTSRSDQGQEPTAIALQLCKWYQDMDP